MVFLEIVALHSCKLRIRLKHLVTACDFNNLCSKSVGLQLAAIWKKKIIRWCFSKISGNKIKTPTFQNTFCWLLSLHWKNNREEKWKHLLHTALIFNAFFDESKDIRKRYSLKSVRSEEAKWKIQYLSKLKTHLVSFVFGFRYQISDKNKNKTFRSMGDFEPAKSASAVLFI